MYKLFKCGKHPFNVIWNLIKSQSHDTILVSAFPKVGKTYFSTYNKTHGGKYHQVIDLDFGDIKDDLEQNYNTSLSNLSNKSLNLVIDTYNSTLKWLQYSLRPARLSTNLFEKPNLILTNMYDGLYDCIFLPHFKDLSPYYEELIDVNTKIYKSDKYSAKQYVDWVKVWINSFFSDSDKNTRLFILSDGSYIGEVLNSPENYVVWEVDFRRYSDNFVKEVYFITHKDYKANIDGKIASFISLTKQSKIVSRK